MKLLLPALGILVLAAAAAVYAVIRLAACVGNMCDTVGDYLWGGD